MAEALKHRFNRGRRSNLSFYRDSRGLECDLLYENGNGIGLIEIKAGATVASDYFSALNRVAGILPRVTRRIVVYGGRDSQSRSDGDVVPLHQLSATLQQIDAA